MMEPILVTFNGRNTFIICTQKRLKGTQKGPKHYFVLILQQIKPSASFLDSANYPFDVHLRNL